MSSLLPNNATPQEVALDLATARVGNVDVPIRTLWDPENCPADILPWLAWAFSVDKWDATWTEAQKRAIVAAAIFVHRRKGTPAVVKAAVGAIFTGANVVEPWDDASLTAHQFKIVTTDTLESNADFDELIRLVDAAKPVRSWLVAVQIQREITDTVYVGTATRSGGKTTLRGRLAIDPDALDLFYGVATRYATRTTIDAQDPSFAVNGFEPEFVASFAKSSPDVNRWNYYRANGVEVDFSKAFDFARAGSATYVDSNGVLQTAGVNVPRIGHHVWNGSAWVNEGLLHESASATNLLLNSDSLESQTVQLTPGDDYTLSFASGNSVVDIDASIAATAVDVFVYDTSKDSDGGAWRTSALAQASSWYNETLNTATRGSRREFPAVAVIVAETNKVTIYDGDDPSLPMWMVIPIGGHITANTSIAAYNSILSIGGSLYGVVLVSFAEDSISRHRSTVAASGFKLPSSLISDRSVSATAFDGSLPAIVSNTINDVAMTVLPDAPIDPATGLPVPTIAVATDGNGTYSTSVITDDGTVYDIASDSTGTAVSVAFDGVSLSVIRSDGAVYVWDDVGAITTDGISPGATYSASSTPALLGTVSKVAA